MGARRQDKGALAPFPSENSKARFASITTFGSHKKNKIVATGHVSLAHNIAKCVCGPLGGAYSAPQTP